jgi:hypothetical protein
MLVLAVFSVEGLSIFSFLESDGFEPVALLNEQHDQEEKREKENAEKEKDLRDLKEIDGVYGYEILLWGEDFHVHDGDAVKLLHRLEKPHRHHVPIFLEEQTFII